MRRPTDAMRRSGSAGGFELARLIGRVLADRFRVDGLLGVGRLGAVLRCRHTWVDRDVALKVLHPEVCRRVEIATRFEQRARCAAALDHPNCVHVFECGGWQLRDLPSSRYLSMELLCGVDLARVLDHSVPPAFALDVIRQLLDGLAHAHARGVVHGDLKPENVMVVPSGSKGSLVKLLDVGMARALEPELRVDSSSRADRIACAPGFASPEQITGDPIDGRADLYAVGVLLYRMLAGRLPFESDDVERLLELHLAVSPPPLPSGIPPALASFTARLMQKAPDRRPESAALARTELEEVLCAASDGIAPSFLQGPRRRSTRPRLPELAVDDIADDRPSAPKRMVVAPAQTTVALTHPAIVRSRLRLEAYFAALAVLVVLAAALAVSLRPRGAPEVHHATVTRASSADGAALVNASLVAHGRTLAASPATRAEALRLYDGMLARDRAVLDDPQAFAEIAALVRDPQLRRAGLQVVLDHFGSRGAPLLVELLNAPALPLRYADRQRALAVIAHDPALLALVDRTRLDVMDLREAGQAELPCLAFAAALARIDRTRPSVAPAELADIVPPSSPAQADLATRELCDRLPQLLAETRSRLDR